MNAWQQGNGGPVRALCCLRYSARTPQRNPHDCLGQPGMVEVTLAENEARRHGFVPVVPTSLRPPAMIAKYSDTLFCSGGLRPSSSALIAPLQRLIVTIFCNH